MTARQQAKGKVVAFPTVGVHLGVKDEVDLIGPCIAHLRALGVGEVVVHDMTSTDGTRDWLAQNAGSGLRVVDSPLGASEQGLIDLFGATVAGMRSDWVLMIDADEFPLPASGDLRRDLAGVGAGMLRMSRFNVALGPAGPRFPLPAGPATYGQTDLYARRDPGFAARLAADPSLYWLRAVPQPKVAVRPGLLGQFAPGMHDVSPRDGAVMHRAEASGLIIAHLPLTTYDRFARKVRNIREMFATHDGNLPEGFGWHWRRWVAQDREGTLRAEYDRSVQPETALAALRAAGEVRTAEDLLGLAG